MEEREVFINSNLSISRDELDFRFSRSGGPGGQHVNRVESKVELLFDVKNSTSLSESQKAQLLKKLASQLDNDGVLHIVDQTHRSQSRNREEAILKFQKLLQETLKPRKKRKKTKPTKSSIERRLQSKKRQSEKKGRRRKVDLD